jgi:hypothetical protein
MLWQGEELAENYTLPPSGNARISTPRDMHWEYFYDQYGKAQTKIPTNIPKDLIGDIDLRYCTRRSALL